MQSKNLAIAIWQPCLVRVHGVRRLVPVRDEDLADLALRVRVDGVRLIFRLYLFYHYSHCSLFLSLFFDISSVIESLYDKLMFDNLSEHKPKASNDEVSI